MEETATFKCHIICDMIPIKNEYARDTISVKVFINIHDSFNILKLVGLLEKSQD